MPEYRDTWEVSNLDEFKAKLEMNDNFEFNGRPIAVVVTDPDAFEEFRSIAKKR